MSTRFFAAMLFVSARKCAFGGDQMRPPSYRAVLLKRTESSRVRHPRTRNPSNLRKSQSIQEMTYLGVRKMKVFRSTMTDFQGHFILENLRSERYNLLFEGSDQSEHTCLAAVLLRLLKQSWLPQLGC